MSKTLAMLAASETQTDAGLSARAGLSSSSTAAARRLQRSHERYSSVGTSAAAETTALTFEEKVALAKQQYAQLLIVNSDDRKAAALQPNVQLSQSTPPPAAAPPQPARRAPPSTQPALHTTHPSRPKPPSSQPQRAPAKPIQPAMTTPPHQPPLPQQPTPSHSALLQRLPPQPPSGALAKIIAEVPPQLSPTPASSAGPCDKCDGPHATDACPHFKKAREKHRDAWEAYKPPLKLASSSEGASATNKRPTDTKRTAEEAAAAAARQLRGATVVKQPGDGSCLFHSLAYGARQLPGGAGASLTTAEGVRSSVLRFIEKNPSEECAGVPLRDWISWESGLEPAAYCQRMRQPGAWGGAIEMLCFSRVANVSVRVYERKGDAFEQISAFDVEHQTGAAQRLVRVLYSGRSHYDALTA